MKLNIEMLRFMLQKFVRKSRKEGARIRGVKLRNFKYKVDYN